MQPSDITAQQRQTHEQCTRGLTKVCFLGEANLYVTCSAHGFRSVLPGDGTTCEEVQMLEQRSVKHSFAALQAICTQPASSHM